MLYFAYGSNMDLSRINGRLGRIPPYQPGKLPGYALRFNKIASEHSKEGYANIVECATEAVWGLLYDVSEEELAALDRYEGVSGGHYERKEVKVETDSGPAAAITYIACPAKVREGLKPTRKYLNYLLAAQHLLPKQYVEKLRATETLD